MLASLRRSLPLFSRLVLAAMLFVQLLLMAQACLVSSAEILAANVHATAMQEMEDATPDCDRHQKIVPAVCQAYFDQSHQLPGGPHLPPIVFFAAFILILTLPRIFISPARHFETLWLKRTTAPPLAIQFCRFQQ